MREILKNASQTTLAASALSTDTSLTVVDATKLPGANARLIVDNELMILTGVSGNIIDVTRGAEGTVAAAHSSGVAVTHICTVGGTVAYHRQNDPWFEGSRPAYGIFDASGNAITSADFSAVNVGSGTVADQNGTIAVSLPSISGESVVFLGRPAPARPYSIVANLEALFFQNGSSCFQRVGVGFRDSAAGSLWLASLEQSSTGSNAIVGKYSSPTSFSSTALGRVPWTATRHWFKATDDGTDISVSISHDGINWLSIFSESRTAFFASGPDSVGFFAENDCTSNANLLASLLSWSGA